MIVDSGAPGVRLSPDGSYFSFPLEPAFKLPRDADVSLSVLSASIWWTVPNIIEGKNDQVSFQGPNTLDVVSTFNLTITQGLYSLDQLNSAFNLALEIAGAKPNFVSLTADDSTGRVIVRLNYAGSTMFLGPNSCYLILGFPSGTTIVSGVTTAPNVAQFNPVDSFLIHSSLCDSGIRINNDYTNTIAQVLINVAPGSQIVAEFLHPPVVSANRLKGLTNSVEMWLTNSRNERVNTNNEYWSVRLRIKY